jgi:hypothetical protein
MNKDMDMDTDMKLTWTPGLDGVYFITVSPYTTVPLYGIKLYRTVRV